MSEVINPSVSQERIAGIVSSVKRIMRNPYLLAALEQHDQHIDNLGILIPQYRDGDHVSTRPSNDEPEMVTLSVNVPEIGIKGGINSYNIDAKGRVFGIFLDTEINNDGEYYSYLEIREEKGKFVVGKPSFDEEDSLLPPPDEVLLSIENKLPELVSYVEKIANQTLIQTEA